MTTGKKYDFRVVQVESDQNKASWTAEIVRRVSSKRSTVSKSQTGFASESDAQAWGEQELKAFVLNQSERNKRQSEQRKLDEQKSEQRRRESRRSVQHPPE